MQSEIKITNRSGAVVIDIEGVIGVPERMQFEQPGERVATYEKFTETLKRISSLKAGRIEVNIRSSGGDINDALLIYDALTGSGAKVTTRCYGYVASAATIIAQAASPGCREISANTLYLIHCSESAAEGNTHSLSQARELLDKTDQRIAAIYSARSGRPAEGFAALMNENNGRGRWMSAAETVDAGLADKVLSTSKVADSSVVGCDRDFDALVDMLGLPRLPESSVRGGVETGFPRRLLRAAVRLRRLLGVKSGTAGAAKAGGEAKKDAGAEAVGSHASGGRPSVTGRTVTLGQPDRQSSGRPTATKPKEDPSPADHIRTPNEQAYDSDIQNIKSR